MGNLHPLFWAMLFATCHTSYGKSAPTVLGNVICHVSHKLWEICTHCSRQCHLPLVTQAMGNLHPLFWAMSFATCYTSYGKSAPTVLGNVICHLLHKLWEICTHCSRQCHLPLVTQAMGNLHPLFWAMLFATCHTSYGKSAPTVLGNVFCHVLYNLWEICAHCSGQCQCEQKK